MRSHVLMYFELLTYWLYSFPRRLKDFLDIRVLKLDRKLEMRFERRPLVGQVAIVALFPRHGVLKSVKRLISSLEQDGFRTYVLVGNNSLSEAWIGDLRSVASVMVARKSIGRDIGAYRAALLSLRPSIESGQIQAVGLFNDSVLYTPKSFQLLRRMADSKGNWVTLFTNLQFHAHAQAFAMILRSPIITSGWFWDFWLKYYPSSQKRPAINKGEVGFSQTAMRNGERPQTIVTEDLLRDQLENLSLEDTRLGVIELFALDDMGAGRHKTLQAWLSWKSEFRISPYPRAELWALASEAFSTRNPTHAVGLLAARVGAPIKLDIVRSGVAPIGAVLLALKECGVDETELNEIRSELESVGSPVSAHGLLARWRRRNLI